MSVSAATKSGQGEGRFEAAELLKLGYRDLQKLAKENNVCAEKAGGRLG